MYIKEDYTYSNIIYLNMSNYCIQSRYTNTKIKCITIDVANDILNEYKNITRDIDKKLTTDEKKNIRKERVAELLLLCYYNKLITLTPKLNEFIHSNVVYINNNSDDNITKNTNLLIDPWERNKDVLEIESESCKNYTHRKLKILEL